MGTTRQPPAPGIYVPVVENPLHELTMVMPEYDICPLESLWSKSDVYFVTGETFEKHGRVYVVLQSIFRSSFPARMVALFCLADGLNRRELIDEFDDHFACIEKNAAELLLRSRKRHFFTPQARQALERAASRLGRSAVPPDSI